MLLFGFVVGEFHRERGGTLGREALGVAIGFWLEGQKLGNRSILPDKPRAHQTFHETGVCVHPCDFLGCAA
jgi:hypothetical protein